MLAELELLPPDPCSAEARAVALERYAQAQRDPRADAYATVEEQITAALATTIDAQRSSADTIAFGRHTRARFRPGRVDVEARGAPWRVSALRPRNVEHFASMLASLERASARMARSAAWARLASWLPASQHRARIQAALSGVPVVASWSTLEIQRASGAWTGPHSLVESRATFASFPWAMFPSDGAVLAVVGAELAVAARAADRMDARVCAICSRELVPWHMFNALACNPCAELYLGIIH
ncbi:MAG: hypothetical protein ABJE95_34590 [Byssovorax sp.]